jgi:hypothetical protein
MRLGVIFMGKRQKDDSKNPLNWPVQIAAFSKRSDNLLNGILCVYPLIRDFVLYELNVRLREAELGNVLDTIDLLNYGKRRSRDKQKTKEKWNDEEKYAYNAYRIFKTSVPEARKKAYDLCKKTKGETDKGLRDEEQYSKFLAFFEEAVNKMVRLEDEMHVELKGRLLNFLQCYPKFVQAYVSEEVGIKAITARVRNVHIKYMDEIMNVIRALYGEQTVQDYLEFYKANAEVRDYITRRFVKGSIDKEGTGVKALAKSSLSNYSFGVLTEPTKNKKGLARIKLLTPEGVIKRPYEKILAKGTFTYYPGDVSGGLPIFIKAGDTIELPPAAVELFKRFEAMPRVTELTDNKLIVHSTPVKVDGKGKYRRARCFIIIPWLGMFPVFRKDKDFGVDFDKLDPTSLQIYRSSDRRIHCTLKINGIYSKDDVHERYVKQDDGTFVRIEKYRDHALHKHTCCKTAVVMRPLYVNGMAFVIDAAGRQEVFGADILTKLERMFAYRSGLEKILSNKRTERRELIAAREAGATVNEDTVETLKQEIIKLTTAKRKSHNKAANIRDDFWKQFVSYLCREYEEVKIGEWRKRAKGKDTDYADGETEYSECKGKKESIPKKVEKYFNRKNANIAFRTFVSKLRKSSKSYKINVDETVDISKFFAKAKCPDCGSNMILSEKDKVEIPGTKKFRSIAGCKIPSFICIDCRNELSVIQLRAAEILNVDYSKLDIDKYIMYATIIERQQPNKKISKI